MTVILLSVRPVFAHALLSGMKTAEVRRRFPEQPEGREVFVYSSSPDRAVLGTVRLNSIDRPDASRVWDLYRDEIEIDEKPLKDYLESINSAAILRVDRPRRWARPVPLSELRRAVGVEPPQSFRYLDDVQARVLVRLGRAEADDAKAPWPVSVAVG